LLLPPQQIQPSPGALDCVLAAQSIKKIQRLGENNTNQTNTGQIENVGTPTINRRAENKSRTGPHNLLRKKRGRGDWKFRKQLKKDGRRYPSKRTNAGNGHEKSDLLLLAQIEKLNGSSNEESPNHPISNSTVPKNSHASIG